MAHRGNLVGLKDTGKVETAGALGEGAGFLEPTPQGRRGAALTVGMNPFSGVGRGGDRVEVGGVWMGEQDGDQGAFRGPSIGLPHP